MSDYPEMDPFWVENRAKFLAEKSASADPSACGTCRSNAEAGNPVVHDECQQRATLLHAPDHPHYELLAGFSLEENAKLPARFHVPVFDDCGVPNSWLCAVCWEDGVVTGWPCATATKYGTQVFTPLHQAETAQEKQAARIAALEDEIVRLRDQQAKDDDEFVQATAERDRYRLAWRSARERAQAYGEGILRHVADRDTWKRWLKEAEVKVADLEAEREKLVRWHGEDSKTITKLVARVERHRARLVALQNDALSMRGSLSPNGEARKVPFPLGETLTPAVDWLINRVAELEAERHVTNEALSDAAEQLRANRDQITELEENLRAVNAGWNVARNRIAELERPAIEAKRAEIRQSFVELAAQCEQDRDYEGAFDVQCRLREREEQWKREDANPTTDRAEETS